MKLRNLLLAALLLLPVAARAQVVISVPNNGSTATVLNKLAKLTGAPSTATAALTTDALVEGVVVSGAGTTGNALIARSGEANLIFDGATTAGDYVTISGTTAGDGHDFGATLPACGVQVIGRVLSTNGSGGTYPITVLTGAVAAGGVPYSVTCGGTGATTGAAAAPNLSMAYLVCVPTLSSVTGTTAETIIGVCQIPANLIGTHGIIKIWSYEQLSPLNTNSKTVKVRISSTNSVSGTQCASQISTVSTVPSMLAGTLVIAGGATNVQDCASSFTANINLTNTAGAATSDNPTTIDTTAPWYAIITGTLANTGDTITAVAMWVEFFPTGGN